MIDQSALLRQELAERRACLVGAKETAVMVEATLTNASDLELARHALLVPVRERIALLQQAIDSTDAALAPAVCEGCKATPCRCYIAVRRLDEAAVEIVATDEDEDEDTTDRWCVIVGEDGRLTLTTHEQDRERVARELEAEVRARVARHGDPPPSFRDLLKPEYAAELDAIDAGLEALRADDRPIHRPAAPDAPIPGHHHYGGCDPDHPRVNPNGTCEGCGGYGCPQCGKEGCTGGTDCEAS